MLEEPLDEDGAPDFEKIAEQNKLMADNLALRAKLGKQWRKQVGFGAALGAGVVTAFAAVVLWLGADNEDSE